MWGVRLVTLLILRRNLLTRSRKLSCTYFGGLFEFSSLVIFLSVCPPLLNSGGVAVNTVDSKVS
jgi:hypothetical protein